MTKYLLKQFSILILIYFLINLFQFSHPIPKSSFQKILWIQILIGFIPYLFSPRVGRICLIISALCLTRFAPIFHLADNFIFNAGIFIGSLLGILFQEIKTKSYIRINEYNNILILFLFICFLILERFLVYFNFPYLNGYSLQETMYNINISSKEAFALSIETCFSFLFPIMFIYFDKNFNEDSREDYLQALFYVLVINFSIIAIQYFRDPTFLSESTNLTLEVKRNSGLFRDSGSSSFLIPSIFLILILNLEKIEILQKRSNLFPFVISYLLIGITQGRAFWFISLIGMIVILIHFNFLNSKKRFYFVSYGLFILLIISFYYKLDFILEKFKSIKSFTDILLVIDSPRYYLNKISLELWFENFLFGNGIGNFVVSLKDLTIPKSNPLNLIDNPGSFFSGILFEIGILGTFLFILLIRINKNITEWKYLLILFPGLLVGYQIVHPDSSFLFFIIFFIFFDKTNFNSYEKKIILFILVLFLCKLFFSFIQKPELVTFRKFQISKFQLQSFESNKKNDTHDYHVFKGNLKWKLEEGNEYKIEIFLDKSTSRKEIIQKLSFLDNKMKVILEKEIKTTKNIETYEVFNLTKEASYLQVKEELPFLKQFDFTPFCIDIKKFNSVNEFKKN